MPLPDTSAARLAMRVETTAGTQATGAYQKLRWSSESLQLNVATEESDEVREDYQNSDQQAVGFDTSGDIGFQLSYSDMDEPLEAAMRGTWSSAATTGTLTDVDAANGDNSYNRAAGSFLTDGFAAGDWVLWAGFTEAANNGIKRITSVTAAKMIVAGAALTTEAAGDSVACKHDGNLVMGTTLRFFTIERGLTDVARYFKYLGSFINNFGVTIPRRGRITGTMGIMGMDEAESAVEAGSSYSEPSANRIMVGGRHWLETRLDDLDAGIKPTGFGFQLNGNARIITQGDQVVAAGVGAGTWSLSANLGALYEDNTLYQYVRQETSKRLAVIVKDLLGNYYVIELPNAVPTGGTANAPGRNQDVLAETTWAGIRDSTSSTMLQVARINA